MDTEVRVPALMRELRVAPSILSADFARLGSQVQEVLDAGARVIHVDVMDGHFVPPITFGALIVAALADLVHAAGAMIDVHLMIERPERQVEEFARAGADNITIHFEATPHVHYTLAAIREAGCMAGAAICPATPADALDEVAEETLDLALCMSVNPGWGAQQFIPASLGKLARMRQALPDRVALEVDGGIHENTAPQVVRAGANLLVTGSRIFGSPEPVAAYEALVGAAGAR
jgi:ribulose-phosphate 3-epimerase